MTAVGQRSFDPSILTFNGIQRVAVRFAHYISLVNKMPPINEDWGHKFEFKLIVLCVVFVDYFSIAYPTTLSSVDKTKNPFQGSLRVLSSLYTFTGIGDFQPPRTYLAKSELLTYQLVGVMLHFRLGVLFNTLSPTRYSVGFTQFD